MVCASSSFSVTSRSIVPRLEGVKVIAEFQRTFNFSFAMAFACLAFVTVLVPERPNQLASICEKYNSAIACRVW